VSLAYQWLRCAADGAGCTAIAGATSATHVAVAADAGHRLETRITATNVVGSVEALSRLSGIVIAAPRIEKAPHISGRSRIGRRLTASPGTWSGPPNAYGYQWLRCNARGRACHAIRHATRARFRLTRLDAGRRLRVRVTAVNAAGSATAGSKASRRVAAAR
jgi:hypothetical protein